MALTLIGLKGLKEGLASLNATMALLTALVLTCSSSYFVGTTLLALYLVPMFILNFIRKEIGPGDLGCRFYRLV